MNIEIITPTYPVLKESGFGAFQACRDVLSALTNLGHEACITQCKSVDDLYQVVKRKPDMVVLSAKYMPLINNDDVWFSDFFWAHDIPFTGSKRSTLRFDSDKVLAKAHLSNLGIKTAKHFTASPGEFAQEQDLPYSFPLFLKPIDSANGNGVDEESLVNSFEEFESKVLSIFQDYRQMTLVEEYLEGKEFTVAVINDSNGEMILSAIEIIPPLTSNNMRILGSKVKREDTETILEVQDKDFGPVLNIAGLCYEGLNVSGFGRIDIKMDKNNQCYFMEANLVPGMNRTSSYFPKACNIANKMSYEDVIEKMLGVTIDSINKNLQVVEPLHRLIVKPEEVAVLHGG